MNCLTCGKEFQRKKPTQNCCSKKCADKLKKGKIYEKDVQEMKEAETIIGEPIKDYLHRRYVEELATYRELMIELGINQNARKIKRWFEICEVPIRTPKEAIEAQHVRNPERRVIFRESVTTDEAKRKRAKARQSNYKLSGMETAALSIIQTFGFEVVPEMAMDIFNIDLALTDFKIAIEIDGGNWHTTGKKRQDDRAKEEFLKTQGWTVKRYNPKMFGELVQDLLALKRE